MPRKVKLPHTQDTFTLTDHGEHSLIERFTDPVNKNITIKKYTFFPEGHPNQDRARVEVFEYGAQDIQSAKSMYEAVPAKNTYFVPIDELEVNDSSSNVNSSAEEPVSYWNKDSQPAPPRLAYMEYGKTIFFNLPKSKQERSNSVSSAFTVGERVSFVRGESQNPCLGTVIQPQSPYHTVVVSDSYHKSFERFVLDPEISQYEIPKGYVGVLRNDSLTRMDTYLPSAWLDCPNWIGVKVKSEFTHDGVDFNITHKGNIVSIDFSRRLACVSWSHTDPLFYTNVSSKNLFAVPLEHIQLVTFCWEAAWPNGKGKKATEPYSFLALWPDFPQVKSSFNVGDLYITSRDGKTTRVRAADGSQGLVGDGAVVMITVSDSKNPECVIVSGASDNVIGTKFRVPAKHLIPMKHNFFGTNTDVEVVAEVIFRKKDLRGKKGRVVLPTDADGDVGIQFFEEIGGGNLDGAGLDGKCLYLQAGALKVSE